MSDHPSDIYNTISMETKTRQDREKLQLIQKKFRIISADGKNKLVESVQKELTDEQIKAIRRREYYNRRVKAQFAPKQKANYDSENNTTNKNELTVSDQDSKEKSKEREER